MDVPAISPRTFGNEDQLPRVPLPTLEHSCDRFLQWCAPLLNEDELTATKAAVTEFLAPDSPAHRLQKALVGYDAQPGVASWLDDFWAYRYLGRRDRIALNANFFFLFEPSPLGQVDRAAALVDAALRYKGLVDREELPPAQQRGRALSMEQVKYLFSATRIPGTVIDSARTPYSEASPGPSTARHIVVFHRGRMFRLDVIDESGRPRARAEVATALREIVNGTGSDAEPGTSVGHLTTKARAEWAASRAALVAADPRNAANLEVIETALFCVCLDEQLPSSPLDAADALLHGNSANRWFDKSVSLIVFADGTAGFNGEHCKLDGTTIIAFLDTLLADTENAQPVDDAPADGAPRPTEIEFVLDSGLREDIAAAGAAFADYAAATATTTVSIEGFDSERAKALRCSPDAFAQASFQLAHRRAKGLTGATYESIATRSFRHGRTEAMRVVTPEMVAFADAMDDPGATGEERRAAFRAAAEAHVARAKQCQAGDAPEQHLWELELIGRRRGAELGITGADQLALYQSPGWLTMRNDYLSTSAVPSPRVQYFGFGSTSTRCIGVGYALLPGRFDLYLSTPRAVSDQMYVYANELRRAVAELDQLLSEGT